MTKIKENIRLIEKANGLSYYVIKRVSGIDYRKAFNTLEEAEQYLDDLEKNSIRANFDYPLDVIELLFGENEIVDIAYIENNFDDNLKVVLETLTEREARLFVKIWKYGFTFEAVAKQEGVTKERIRQIVNKAVRKIKHPSRLVILRFGKEVKDLQDDITKLTLELSNKKQELIEQINNPQKIVLTKEEKLESIKIEDLDLSVRAYRCLKRANINKLTDLLQKSETDLMRIRNLGRKSLKEIILKLNDMGFSLRNYDTTKEFLRLEELE